MMIWKSVQLWTSEEGEGTDGGSVAVDAGGRARTKAGAVLSAARPPRLLAPARVILLTDQPLVAEGIRHLLLGSSGLELAAVCFDPADLPAVVEAAVADLLIVDWAPKQYEAILPTVKRRFPQTRVVFYLRSLSLDIYRQARRLDVKGILDKSATADEFREALVRIAAGESVFHTALADHFFQADEVALQEEDAALFDMIAQGVPDEQIAARLSLPVRTAKDRVADLLARAGFRDRLGVAVDAVLRRSEVSFSFLSLFTPPEPKQTQADSTNR